MRRVLPLLLLLTSLSSCGEFVGFEDPAEADVGNLDRFELWVGEDELNVLYDSMINDVYAVCRFDDGSGNRSGEIRIRGYKSRYVPKKSFTLRYDDDDGDEVKVALDSGGDPWLSYSLAMYAYQAADVADLEGTPQLEPVALYLNGEYLGYYNVLPLYSEDLQDHYGASGELFQVFVTDFAEDYPIQGLSEKKFPDDDDFGSLNRLLANTANMESVEWEAWVDANVHLEDTALYMAVRDFIGMADTYNSNFYIYYDGKYRILPWDNDHYYAYSALGGNNLLTRRLLESAAFTALYEQYLDDLFVDPVPGPPYPAEYIIDDLEDRMADLVTLLDTAVGNSPVFYLEHDDFVTEQANLTAFFANRPADVTDYLTP